MKKKTEKPAFTLHSEEVMYDNAKKVTAIFNILKGLSLADAKTILRGMETEISSRTIIK